MTTAMPLSMPDDREPLTTEQSADLRHDVRGVQNGQLQRAVDTLERADEIRERVQQIKAEIYGRYRTDNPSEPEPDRDCGGGH